MDEGPELISTLGSTVLIDGIELALTENYFFSLLYFNRRIVID